MQKSSHASPSRPARRFVVWGSALASCAALVSAGGCTSGEAGPPATAGNVSSSGTAGFGSGGRTGNTGGTGTAGSAVSSGGTSGTTAGATSAAGTGTGGAGTGGVAAGSGGSTSTAGSSAGGAATAGAGAVSGGGTGGTAAPCVDVEPPPNAEWPDANCQKWAAETEECSADWFQKYCDVSCGRCVPEGSGGTGGSAGAGGTGSKPCVDVEPPPDPEWPGATCESWALETDECGASWFQQYCDVSCGRCVPEGGTGGTGSTAPDCSSLQQVNGGDGFATRYWDCCQPHCAQFDGHKCGQDGVQRTGDQTSACSGGNAFACYDEAPRAVSECLSYGHIAKASPNCGGCYRIQFTGEGQHNVNDPGSRLIKGKQMIVKVTNTGGDVAANQFDLMIPGGGVGRFNACSRQWNQQDLGAQYGGFLTDCTGTHSAKKECVRQECMKIPSGPARDGCLWFVDWFQVADNPKFKSEPTNCPF